MKLFLGSSGFMAAAATASATSSSSSTPVEISYICSFDEAYADHGTSSHMDLSVYQGDDHCKDATATWFEVGHVAVGGYHLPTTCSIAINAASASADIVATPTGMTLNWDDKKGTGTHGSRNGGLYTASCPPGFVALGSVGLYKDDVITANITAADFPRLRCVAESLAVQVPSKDLTLVWDDHGSGCDYDGSVWSTGSAGSFNTSTGTTVQGPMFAGSKDSYDAPTTAWVLDQSKITVATSGVRTCSPPEQVHTSFGLTPDTLNVQWATMSAVAPTNHTLQWGVDEKFSQGGKVPAQVTAFTADSGRVWYNLVATMTGLAPVTKYFYRVGNDLDGWSETFPIKSQVTQSTLSANLPQRHIIFGDMGSACAFTLCSSCTCDLVCDKTTCAANTSIGIVSELETASMILHAGDFGYNLDSNGGTVGDQFMRNIEQVAARVPYMVSIGNHEDGDTALAHFTERFRLMPSAHSTPNITKTVNGVAPNNWFFSWDDGLVHYVAINTEAWFGVGTKSGQATLAEQYKWLKADLEAANANRKNVPWIVVHGHRSMYCSCDGDCDAAATLIRDGPYGLEELFMDVGVDFFLNGHEHNYERNWPTYKFKSDQSNVEPKAPIYIITGAAGCTELHEPFTRKQPPRSAFRSNNFGYSRFIVHNASHARWQQVIMDPGNVSTGQSFFGASLPPMGSVIDDTWIIQHNHGPFNRSLAPQSEGECKPETCHTFDHWSGRFEQAMHRMAKRVHQEQGINITHALHNRSNTTHIRAHELSAELIQQFREEFGEGSWVQVEVEQLQTFMNEYPFDNLKWEDVSPDGGSDGKWGEGVYEPSTK